MSTAERRIATKNAIVYAIEWFFLPTVARFISEGKLTTASCGGAKEIDAFIAERSNKQSDLIR